MGFIDAIKNLVSVPDEDDYDEYEEEEVEPEASSTDFYSKSRSRRSSYDYDDEPAPQRSERTERTERVERKPAAERRPASSYPADTKKVVNFSGGANYQMVLIKPESFGEATSVADNLLNKNTVVLNLESISPGAARKLIDFLAGVTYAVSGQFKQVAGNTYVITPNGVDIRGDLSFGGMDDLDNFTI